MCVLISLQLLFETFLILRIKQDMIKHTYIHIGLHVKYLLFLSDFNVTLIFLTDFFKYSNIKFHKNPSSRR